MTENYGRLIKLAANQMTRQMDDYARQYGLTGTQMSLLDFVAHAPGACLQRDIEQEFNIRRSTATVLLKRMTDAELVRRGPHPADARQRTVVLTAKGQQLQQVTQAYIARTQAAFVAAFTPAARQTFAEMLAFWQGGEARV